MKDKVLIAGHGSSEEIEAIKRLISEGDKVVLVDDFENTEYHKIVSFDHSYLVEGFGKPTIKNKSGIGCPYHKKGIHNYPQPMIHELMNQKMIDEARRKSRICSLCGYEKN